MLAETLSTNFPRQRDHSRSRSYIAGKVQRTGAHEEVWWRMSMELISKVKIVFGAQTTIGTIGALLKIGVNDKT